MICGNTKAQTKSNVYEQAIIDSVASYVDAFNKRDAKTISQHWAGDGEYIDSEGDLIAGRQNIEQAFVTVFKDMPADNQLAVTIKRISFVTKDVAIEEGIADFAGQKTNYSAVHKLQNGKWHLHSIRETEIAPRSSNYGKLKELEWMVGEWVDQSDDAVVRTSCRWSKNQNFLTKSFSVSLPDMDPLDGTQIIGYDASTGQIRSWTFDSDGGFAQGTWSRKANKWTVSSQHTMNDGRKASSTNIFTLVGQNQFSWKSIGRQVDGEFLPNVAPVNVVRITEVQKPEIVTQKPAKNKLK